MKKVSYIFIVLILAIVLTGCTSEKSKNNKSLTTSSNKTNTNIENKNSETKNKEENTLENVNYAEAAEKQMSMPAENETIAIIKVKDFGDIKVKFFKDIAPKAVENFITHAKNGYYNGLTFHRVINEFMIQGGDPLGNGTGGESIWGKGFGVELDPTLVPYRGSLCMAMSSLPNSIGSQFFITQANYSDVMNNYLQKYGYPDSLLQEYKKYGGYLSLYMQYTVFGQVYEGMDVVDKIAAVETETTPTGQADKPVKDVIIEKIEVKD